jgi:hypothetical protein
MTHFIFYFFIFFVITIFFLDKEAVVLFVSTKDFFFTSFALFLRAALDNFTLCTTSNSRVGIRAPRFKSAVCVSSRLIFGKA